MVWSAVLDASWSALTHTTSNELFAGVNADDVMSTFSAGVPVQRVTGALTEIVMA
jgi:hypothetical protein